jgi:hypothetical protein
MHRDIVSSIAFRPHQHPESLIPLYWSYPGSTAKSSVLRTWILSSSSAHTLYAISRGRLFPEIGLHIILYPKYEIADNQPIAAMVLKK